jgi:glycerol-3-phosphate acyltransferase PlsY
MIVIGFILFFYLIGSIPFGLILTRLAGLGDLRSIGSGNIGATNVLRTGNKGLAALTLIFDTAKAWVPMVFLMNAQDDFPDPFQDPFFGLALWIVGFSVVLGHCFPVFLRFRGGKGVATTLGVYTGMDPVLGACIAFLWLGVALAFRYSSLAALVTVICMPLVFMAYTTSPNSWDVLPLVAISLLVIWRHKDNIRRLKQGQESPIRLKKAPVP